MGMPARTIRLKILQYVAVEADISHEGEGRNPFRHSQHERPTNPCSVSPLSGLAGSQP